MEPINIDELTIGEFEPSEEPTPEEQEALRIFRDAGQSATLYMKQEAAIKLRDTMISKLLQSYWIPVEERFPDDDQTALVYEADGIMEVATYDKEHRWWWFEEGWRSADATDKERVVAWLPLPKPYIKPQGKEQEA